MLSIHGQETKTYRSSDITINGLDLNQITEKIASSLSVSNDKKYAENPMVIWLIDNTSYLKTQKCPELLSGAITKGFAKYPNLKMAVVRYANTPKIITENAAIKDITKSINSAFNSPDNDSKDPCAAIRFCMENFKKYQQKKHIIIFTIQNNDIESDLEETLTQLIANNFTLNVISGGAVMSNSNTDPYGRQPENTTIHRAESAEIELEFKNPHLDWWYPKGIPAEGVKSGDEFFRHNYPFYNTFVFSGFGVYGLSRLAAYSGGKYFLYYPPSNAKSSSFCELHLCLICDDKKNHTGATGCNTAYNKFLPAMAPILISREEYSAKYGPDPMYQLLNDIKSRSGGCWLPTGLNTIFDENGKLTNAYSYQIDRAFTTMDEMIKKLNDLLAEINSKGDIRFQAHCAIAMANLYLERFNLTQFKYCIESDLAKKVTDKNSKQNWSLAYLVPIFECFCHTEELTGVTYPQKSKDDYIKASDIKTKIAGALKTFIQKKKIDLYGGTKSEEDLSSTFEEISKVITRYKGTPWELVARRLPWIAKFRIEFGSSGNQRTNLRPGEPPPPTQNQTPGLTPTQSGPTATETGK